MIKPINHHYSFENPATIYDEESMTPLELAGRTAGKVNEVVISQNKLVVDTDAHLAEQDRAIEKMNTVTMPEKVTAEVQRKIESGEFDQAINRYAGGLEDRLDNLLENIPEGSTTMDAEVIDTRTDIFGGVASNAGNAVRSQVAKLHEMVTPLVDYQLEKVSVSINPGYYDKTGKFNQNIEGATHHCARVSVTPGEIYLIYTRYGMVIADAMALDSNGVLLRLYNEQTGSIAINNFDKPIHIPDKAATLVINCVSGDSITVYKVVGYSLNIKSAWETFSGMFKALRDETPILGDVVPLSVELASCLDNGVVTTVTSGHTDYRTATLSVKPGEVYYLDVSARFAQNYYYSFFDIHGNMITGKSYDAEQGYFIKETLLVPPGAYVMCVSGYTTDPAVYHVNGFRTAVGSMSGLKWYCIGDSLTEKNQRTEKNYHDYVAAASGIQVVNCGVSGSGYMRGEDNAFHKRITADMVNADVITIFGSGNDLQNIGVLGNPTDTGTDTICGCINTTIDNIYSVAPTVQLGIVSPTPWVGNEPGDNGTMCRYCEALEVICKRRGIAYLDLFHCSGLRPNSAAFRELAYSKDEGNGVHPDETGHKMISGHFLKFLESLVSTY